MFRKARPLDSRQERLLADRDDLQIQISLAADAPKPNADEIETLQRQLARLEDEISKTRSYPYS
jgi:uncharacterized protein YdcH (DUF465 family)